MKLFYLIYILFIFLFTSLTGQQPYHFERLTDKEGLSKEYIFCIHQGKNGYLWFGTWDGLNRYDGYQLDLIKPDPGNPHSLSTNCVTAIAEDPSGAMWIGTNGGGLLKLLPQWYYSGKMSSEQTGSTSNEQAFVQLRSNPNNPNSISNDNITSLCYDNNGYLWIGTYGGGVNVINPKDTTKNYNIQNTFGPDGKDGLQNENITKILNDREDNIWIGTSSSGLYIIPATEIKNGLNNITSKCHQHNKNVGNGISSNNITALVEDINGNIWIGTNGGGLNLLLQEEKEKSSPSFIHFKHNPNNPSSLSNNNIKSLYIDHLDNLWTGTDNGLNKTVISGNTISSSGFKHYKHDPLDPLTISNNHIESLFEDRAGILWIGTYNGLNKLDQTKKPFTHYRSLPGNQNTFINNTVNAIVKDHEDVLWIGTESGILTQTAPGQQKKHYFLSNGKALTFNTAQANSRHSLPVFLRNPALLSGTFINTIIEDMDHNLWIGSAGLYRFDENRRIIDFYHPEFGENQSLSDWNIWAVYQDKAGEIWIGTSKGLDNYDKTTNSFIHYRHNPDDPNSISSNMIWCIFEDNKGNIWIGTEKGLNRFKNYNTNNGKKPDPENAVFETFYHDPENPQSISSNRIWFIYQDNRDIMWIGTEGGGLNKMIMKNDTVHRFIGYKENDGLPGNIVCGIISDDNNNLWISTSDGLARFTPEEERFKNYGINDGLQSIKFRKGACLKDEQSKLFFGDHKGYISFSPDSIKDNPVPPKVVITNFKIFNKPVPVGEKEGRTILSKPISSTKKINLSYKDNVFSFEFVALHFSSPEENQYAYKMEGFEEHWNHTNYKRRFASYTNLPPGKYTFSVKASNSDGIWNEQGMSVDISIKPPVWKTWWAYILYVIFLGFIVYAIIQYTVGKERLKNQLRLERLESAKKHELAQKAHEVDQMKLRFITNISHEFRTPLTLILGPLENLAATFVSNNTINKKIQIIHRNAQHLLRLINQLMDFRKLDTGSMDLNVQKGDIVTFLKRIKASFEYLAQERQVKLVFKSEYQSYDIWYDPNVIEKVFYNLLSNAFKFVNNNGKIAVILQKPGNTQSTDDKQQEYISITVKDNGVGIPQKQLEKIFDRFYQIEQPQTGQGTGIGLSLTKELIEMHHGFIEVKSKVNKGTEFNVYLPDGDNQYNEDEISSTKYEDHDKNIVVTEEITGKQCNNEEEIINEESTKPILLVVEDNSDLCMYINESLKEQFKIITASDGNKGYRKANEIIPDLIITDIMMPDMDGYQLCEKLKKDELTMHIPIIILTALTSENSKIQGLETGADDYITKPFNTNILKLKVKNLIESRQKLKVLYSKQLINKDESNTKTDPFIQKAIDTLEENIENPDYGVEQYALDMGLSRAQLFRKIKGLTDQTVSEFIRNIKIRKAAELLKNDKLNVNEVIYKIGFNSQSYFNKCFRELYGTSPGEYASK